jgi:hypothetical protein
MRPRLQSPKCSCRVSSLWVESFAGRCCADSMMVRFAPDATRTLDHFCEFGGCSRPYWTDGFKFGDNPFGVDVPPPEALRNFGKKLF